MKINYINQLGYSEQSVTTNKYKYFCLKWAFIAYINLVLTILGYNEPRL